MKRSSMMPVMKTIGTPLPATLLPMACGQLGQSYQDYKCPAGEEHMACEVDPEMEMVASTNAKWYGAPGPMFCAPKSKVPKAPRWDHSMGWCDPQVDYPPIKGDDFWAVVNGE